MAVKYKPYNRVKKIGGKTFRQLIPATKEPFYYVSIGDSITAGQAINNPKEWDVQGGAYYQYWADDSNLTTTILSGTYTDLLQKDLQSKMTDKLVKATSFGRSGATVDDLVEMLQEGTDGNTRTPIPGSNNTADGSATWYGENPVVEAIKKANLVTCMIGANAYLGPLSSFVESGAIQEFFLDGNQSLSGIKLSDAEIDSQCWGLGAAFSKGVLTLKGIPQANGSIQRIGTSKQGSATISYKYKHSYTELFTLLYAINPSATYVFSTIHNPYKYIYLDDNYLKGFLGWFWDGIEDILETVIDELSPWKTIQKQVNGLDPWLEPYIIEMNRAITESISSFGKSNFIYADTKEVYDGVPDRPSAPSNTIRYNDLVSVNITQGADVTELNWGFIYEAYGYPGDAWGYWDNVLLPIVNWNVNNIGNMVMQLVTDLATYVIPKEIDPHPKYAGHEALYYSFADALSSIYNTATTKRVTYYPNGVSGAAKTQRFVNNLSSKNVYTKLQSNTFSPNTGYRLVGWANQAGASSATMGECSINWFSDSTSIYAIWSNKYKLTLKQVDQSALGVSYNTTIKPYDLVPNEVKWALEIAGVSNYSFNTGNNYDDRRVSYNGTNLTSNLTFDDHGSRTNTYDIEYGKQIAINVRSKQPNDWIQEYIMEGWDCWIKDGNGNVVSRGSKAVAQGTVTGDVEITLYFKSSGSYITFSDKAKVCWDVETKGIVLEATTAEDW